MNDYDVAVVGGGTTGCCAAIAAARLGARVLLIEKLPFPGGNMTGGLPWLGFHEKASRRPVVGGIPIEIIKRLKEKGGATEFVFDPITGSAVGVNGVMLKMILEKMLLEAGVKIMLHSLLSDCREQEDGCALTVSCKGETMRVTCGVLIDCTDSADAALRMGARLVTGRESDGFRQVSSYVVSFGNIDFSEMLAYFKAHPTQIRPFKLSDAALASLLAQMETAPLWVLGAFEDIISRARANGVSYPRRQLIGAAYPAYGNLTLVSSRVENVECQNVGEFTRAEIEGLQQTWGILELLNNYIPGCSNARILSSGAQLGVRESNHCVGEYTLTASDLLCGARFEDAVLCGAYHIDIHSPDHDGLETSQPPVYQVPLRSLLPKGTRRLLVAGRCVSATHEAMASTRVAPISAAMGEAAGVVAGLAALSNTEPRRVPYGETKKILIRNNAIIE